MPSTHFNTQYLYIWLSNNFGFNLCWKWYKINGLIDTRLCDWFQFVSKAAHNFDHFIECTQSIFNVNASKLNVFYEIYMLRAFTTGPTLGTFAVPFNGSLLILSTWHGISCHCINKLFHFVFFHFMSISCSLLFLASIRLVMIESKVYWVVHCFFYSPDPVQSGYQLCDCCHTKVNIQNCFINLIVKLCAIHKTEGAWHEREIGKRT